MRSNAPPLLWDVLKKHKPGPLLFFTIIVDGRDPGCDFFAFYIGRPVCVDATKVLSLR
jgi:hypothetical protein